MTVKLLVDWKDPSTGRQYRIGNLLDTDDYTEAGLIASKQAQADLTGGTAQTDPVVNHGDGQVVRANAAGTALVVNGVQFSNSVTQSATYDISQARLAGYEPVSLTVPTYVVGDNQLVHPSVVYIDGGWNGYSYWMAMTPYSGADSQYENPSILCSNDGRVWAAPSGVTNPLVAHPGGTHYNSDPYLFFLPDGRMCIYYRSQLGTTAEHRYITSIDGSTWTSYTSGLSMTRASEDLLSPSIVWEAENQQYRMFACDDVLSGNAMVTCTSTDLITWSTRAACTYTLPDSVTDLWHPDIRRLPSGQYVGVVQTGTSAGGPVYPIMSKDGTTWHFGPKLINVPNAYKTGFVPIREKWQIFVGNISDKDVRLAECVFDLDVYKSARNAYMAAGTTGTLPTISPYTTWDSFDRSDSAGGLGTPTAGTTWTVEGGTLGIASNLAYAPGAANNKSYINAGYADIDMSVDFSTFGSMNLYFRRVDNSNFWRARLTSSNQVVLEKIVSGSVSAQYIVIWTCTAGDRLRVRAKKSAIQLFVNDAMALSIDSATHIGGSGHGIQITDTTGRMNNFLLGPA